MYVVFNSDTRCKLKDETENIEYIKYSLLVINTCAHYHLFINHLFSSSFIIIIIIVITPQGGNDLLSRNKQFNFW